MMRLSVFWVSAGLFFVSCTGLPQMKPAPTRAPADPGWSIYVEIRDTLKKSGEEIDYDTLMYVYGKMTQTQHEIPHKDRLLKSLINKRNANPRIDQMILIFAAEALGHSKYPVPDACGIFESILSMDHRVTQWVLAFVSEAIEIYPENMPEGDRLMDLLEEKLAMVRSAPGPPKEYFGFHFLPPPKSEFIRSYIAKLRPQAQREKERRHYYELIAKGYAESDIETALRRFHVAGVSGTGERTRTAMEYLSRNLDKIPQR